MELSEVIKKYRIASEYVDEESPKFGLDMSILSLYKRINGSYILLCGETCYHWDSRYQVEYIEFESEKAFMDYYNAHSKLSLILKEATDLTHFSIVSINKAFNEEVADPDGRAGYKEFFHEDFAEYVSFITGLKHKENIITYHFEEVN